MPKIFAIAETRDGQVRPVSRQVVSTARTLAEQVGAEVHVLVLGAAGDAAGALAAVGADTIHVVAGDAVTRYDGEVASRAIAGHIQAAGDAWAVLFAASATGKDLAPRVAARIDRPLASDVTELGIQDGELVITRPILAGRAFARVALDAEPRLVSIRPNVFPVQERAGAGNVADLQADGAPGRVVLKEVAAASAGKVDVAEASIIVSGGRGMKGPENWPLLEQLRDALGGNAALGASRAVVDAGWRPHSEQVGQTGKTVSPQLYVAVAISGAMQHLAGMRSSGTIVAINKDPDAPIFKVADYGVVGDAMEILPRLTAEIQKVRGG
ncbi:MAG: electron transfer flavoprotein subunit alpha/FixB family protein [Gemmatimonadota bacterium]|jgi:electron transfer flavoprotein alpha subunit